MIVLVCFFVIATYSYSANRTIIIYRLNQIINRPPINPLVTSLVSELNFLFTKMPCNDLFFRNVYALSDALCKLVADADKAFSSSDDNDEDCWGEVSLR